MSKEVLEMAPDWGKTLSQFGVDEVRQFPVDDNEVNKARAIINRGKKKSIKVFVTNSLLGGGFEIKRTK
jgi:hypothetical protein